MEHNWFTSGSDRLQTINKTHYLEVLRQTREYKPDVTAESDTENYNENL